MIIGARSYYNNEVHRYVIPTTFGSIASINIEADNPTIVKEITLCAGSELFQSLKSVDETFWFMSGNTQGLCRLRVENLNIYRVGPINSNMFGADMPWEINIMAWVSCPSNKFTVQIGDWR
jgi:hypothetical protein